MYGYIYLTVDTITNKCYIGQHKSETYDNKYFGSGLWLKSLYKKRGIDGLKNFMLECCEDKNSLDNAEQQWIGIFKKECGDNCKNIADGAQGGILGNFHRRAISEANKKRFENPKARELMRIKSTGRHFSKETIEKIRQAHLGKKLSEATRKKMSEVRQGKKWLKPMSEEGKLHISEAKKGKHYPKTAEAQRGKVRSIESRRKQSESLKKYFEKLENREKYKSMLGKKHSEETKEKIRLAHLGKKLTTEHINNCSIGLKNYYKLHQHPKPTSKPIKNTQNNMIWPSKKDCFEYYDITKKVLEKWLKDDTKNLIMLDKNYEYQTDGLIEYVWLHPEKTGLNVDIFADDGEAYIRNNHPQYLYVRNGYNKSVEEFIPFLVSEKPCMLYNGFYVKLTNSDIEEVIDFIKENLEVLRTNADMKISHNEFYQSLKSINCL